MLNSNQLNTPLKTSVTNALVYLGPEESVRRLLKTLEIDFPEIRIVYKTSSVGKLWIQKGEPEAQGNEHKL